MEAGKRTINDIFNQNKILEIPFFQRSYVWDEDQWERFISDMEFVSHNNKPYFLGSVILKQQQTNSGQSVGDKRTLIDGQQRLTTMNIVFKVLALKLNNFYLESLFRLPMQNNEIALQHSRNDVVDFRLVMNASSLDLLKGEGNVIRAFNYFTQHLDASQINPQNLLTNLMFVGVDLGHGDDEQQIFDTINSLGVKLTTAELLKNHLFGKEDIERYVQYWEGVFESNEEVRNYWNTEIFAGRFQRSFLDLFLYSYLQIKVQDARLSIRAEDKIEFTKMEGLFESYKQLILKYRIDKVELIAELKEYALIFSGNFDADVVNRDLSGASGIERVNAIIFGLETTTLIPYVLYVLKNVEDVAEREAIFSYLESYVMRRMVCHETTKNYNQIFSDRLISNSILSRDAIKDFINDRSDKIGFMPTNDEVVKGFKESKLVNKQAAGILYFIETKIRNRSYHSTAMAGLDHYSLEHVLPKKWKNNWPAVATEKERDFRNRQLLTLGNLTIIPVSLNSSIRDAAWNIKKIGKGATKGLDHYAAGLDTFSEYLKCAEWNEAVIERRSEFLAEKANLIWQC
ncbi:DUF262 domain-containing protein [Derxia lacustris]|uniref:DUF262 domain-containing protein n=1 Tax=Derxia lacustris TaxID=764842 RepID=UPI000A16D75E|nr:DUF262 domain-containing protein [Derxia lacustris]